MFLGVFKVVNRLGWPGRNSVGTEWHTGKRPRKDIDRWHRMGRSRSIAHEILVTLGWSSWCRVWLEIHPEESRIEYQFGTVCLRYLGTVRIKNGFLGSCVSETKMYANYPWQVQHIMTATLVWLWSRHDLRRGLVPVVVGMLIVTVYRPLMLDFLTSLLLAGPWSALIIKAITTLIMGATTLHIYAGLAHSIGIFWTVYVFFYILMDVQLYRISPLSFCNNCTLHNK